MSSVDRALGLARQGYRVFPVKADKSPRTAHGCKDATTDPDQIRAWWTSMPRAGVGIAAGSGLAVVDLDVKHGIDGTREFRQWADAHGVEWSATTRTRSGGQHVYFRTSQTFANTASKVLPGVDVRSEGGYVVAYGDVPDLDALPPLPDKVADLLGRREPGAGDASGRRISPAGVRAAFDAEVFKVTVVAEQARNNTLNTAAYNLGQLIGPHLDEQEVREALTEAAREAGLEDEEILRAINNGLTAGMANPRTVVPDDDTPKGAWTPVDIVALVAAGLKMAEPTMLARVDGLCLLYPGETHSISGESGSGKSWLGIWACAERLIVDQDVLMLDYESNASTVTARLLGFGVTLEQLRRFTYINPDAAPKGEEFEALLTRRFALAVIDGVTEALALSGLTGDNLTNSNDAITKWSKMLPRRIAQETGAAVVQIDHVTKSKDNRGGYAIGGQAKRSAVTAATYIIVSREKFGRGHSGSFDLYLSKDREGYVQGAVQSDDATMDHVARVNVTCNAQTVERLTLVPPQGPVSPEDRLDATKRAIMQFLKALPDGHAGAGVTMLRRDVPGRAETKDAALKELVAGGYVIREPRGQALLHRFGREYTPFTEYDDAGYDLV
jgi:hypothetical protein